MKSSDEERTILKQLVPQLEEEGYVIFFEPSHQLLPNFMENYRPDAIAVRDDKKLAIEIIVEGPAAKEKEKRLRQQFVNNKDWELRVYYARPSQAKEALPTMPVQTIDASILSIERLISAEQSAAAILLGWATFEALGRAINPDKFVKPQSPGRLMEMLASEGTVTPTEADLLRRLANSRNRLIHGTLNEEVSSTDLIQFVTILKALRRVI